MKANQADFDKILNKWNAKKEWWMSLIDFSSSTLFTFTAPTAGEVKVAVAADADALKEKEYVDFIEQV